MTVGRLRQILDRFDRVRVLVIGDFFLDKYLMVDAGLTERSIETGLPAYQVVEKRVWPGGAGAVAANLRALGAGTVQALGLVGRDGEGYELRTSLEALGVGTALLVETEEYFTPTYTKPVWRGAGPSAMNRLDIRAASRAAGRGQRVRIWLRKSVAAADAVVVADQVPERNCGVITDAVRAGFRHWRAPSGYCLHRRLADARRRVSGPLREAESGRGDPRGFRRGAGRAGVRGDVGRRAGAPRA